MNKKNYNLLEQFMRVQWLLGRYHHHSRMAHGPMGNVYRGQGRILKLLKMQPEISQKDLSELLDMRPQSLGELLSKLERSEYITRTPAEDDKRVMIVCLTEKGAQAQNEEQPEHSDLFSFLSGDEQAELGRYLDRIADALEAQLTDDKEWPENKRHGGHGRGFGSGHHGHGDMFGRRR